MDPADGLTRIQTVRNHMRLECEGDCDSVIATFAHRPPRGGRGTWNWLTELPPHWSNI